MSRLYQEVLAFIDFENAGDWAFLNALRSGIYSRYINLINALNDSATITIHVLRGINLSS